MYTSINTFLHLTSFHNPNFINFSIIYLKLQVFVGLKLTAPNYTDAIDTLTKRFGNKPLIKAWHMDTLLELEPIISPTNIKALRCLYDKIEFQIRSLKSLDVPLDSYGNLLSSLFMTRLPQEFRLVVSREIGEAECVMTR